MISVCCRMSGNAKMLVHADSGHQLVQIADPRTGHQLAVEDALDHQRVVPGRSAVQLRGHHGRVPMIQKPPGRQHFREDSRFAGNHDRTGTGGHQDQPTASARVLKSELLGERTAPGQPEDVDVRAASWSSEDAGLSQQTAQHRCEVRKSVWHRRVRRPAGARHVEAHHGGVRCRAPATNGSSTSRLAPIPLHSTSGIPVPQRMWTRICCPSTGSKVFRSLTRMAASYHGEALSHRACPSPWPQRSWT